MAVGSCLSSVSNEIGWIEDMGDAVYVPKPVPAFTLSSLMTLSGPKPSCLGS
jgi:hypothetical protein